MMIKISFYNFFTRLIGGSFLLAFLFYVLQDLLPVRVNIAAPSLSQLLILGMIAYIIGYAAAPISSIWYRFWAPKDIYQKTINRLNQEMADMGVNIGIMDCYTLLAFVKRINVDMAQDTEKYNEISIMLRSTSLSLLLFSVVFCLESLSSFMHFRSIGLLGLFFLGIVCLFLSILLIKEAVKYHIYFFRSIYQSVVALMLRPEQIFVKFRAQDSGSNEPPTYSD